MKELRCPYCRSLIGYDGTLDFLVTNIQVLPCPVCGYPQWIATDYPVPVKFIDPKILEMNKPLMPWSEFQKTGAGKNLSTPPPTETQNPVYQPVIEQFKKAAQAVTGIGANIGIWVVVVLVLVLLIKKR